MFGWKLIRKSELEDMRTHKLNLFNMQTRSRENSIYDVIKYDPFDISGELSQDQVRELVCRYKDLQNKYSRKYQARDSKGRFVKNDTRD